jgi:adenine phosphoribosyltransferase
MNRSKKLQGIANCLREVNDFPRKGITFYDISPLLANVEKRELAFQMMAESLSGVHIDVVAGLDARGFVFATALASILKTDFVMIRKPSKLPGTVESIEYQYEYSSGKFEVQVIYICVLLAHQRRLEPLRRVKGSWL